jgi:hypothetical protein
VSEVLSVLTTGERNIAALQPQECSRLCSAVPLLHRSIPRTSSRSSSKEALLLAGGGEGVSGSPSAAEALQALLKQLAPQLMQRVLVLLQQGPVDPAHVPYMAAGLGALLQAQRGWANSSNGSSSSSGAGHAQAHSSVAPGAQPGGGTGQWQDTSLPQLQQQAQAHQQQVVQQQQQQQQQDEEVEAIANLLVPVLLSAATPALASYTTPKLLQLLQGLQGLGLEQLPADVANR